MSLERASTQMSTLALVIDEDRTMREFLCRVLEREGMVSLHASNGYEGVTRALGHVPDIILSNHHMPYGSGLDVLKAIRNSERTRSVSFIFISSDHSPSLHRQYLRHGADAFLYKPFTPDELLTLTADILYDADD